MPDQPAGQPSDLPPTAEFAVGPVPEQTAAQDAEGATGNFNRSAPARVFCAERGADGWPGPGQRLGDFEILQVVGRGAFATVFLARQISLDRLVALKVSANRGSEARTLASLEHDHIVRIFTEFVEPERNQRLLCMQFVAGTTLEKVIHKLGASDPSTWSGRAILEAIDTLSTHEAVFDPAALRDREQLRVCDFVEAVCWIGTRLADALAHAHNQGVLHRDIKPANILMNRYGRPLLADFNVARDPKSLAESGGEIFGGTLVYMAPEHIDALNPHEKETAAAAVDARSDIYALGLVLYELLVGKPPFGALPRATKPGSALQLLAGQRRATVPSPAAARPAIPEVLDRVIRRCLASDPAQRYQSATALAEALQGCLDYRRMEKDLPHRGFVTRATLRHPLLVGLLLVFLPHVLGTAVNICYNTLRIVRDHLNEEQQLAFGHITWLYTVVVFTPAIWIALRLMAPIIRVWRQLSGPDLPDDHEVARVRRGALRLPAWDVFLSCLFWLPGGLIVPLVIDCCAGINKALYARFFVGCTISGLIALTYSLFAVQFLALRVLYPRLWVDARGLRRESREELRPLDWRLGVFQLLAGLIPLTAAFLLAVVGPDEETPASSYGSFRLLLTGLILLGMLGFTMALSASRQLQQIFAALIGSDRRRGEGRRDRTSSIISRH
jgi:serine/threonine protein kinase